MRTSEEVPVLIVGAGPSGVMASPLLEQQGIEVVGPDRIQSFIMIHFRASLRGLPELPPGVLFFVCDPRSGGGAFVVHDLDREAVYMHPFDPGVESEADYDAARCAELVRDALEDPGLDFEVATVSSGQMTAQVAEGYRSGRSFLVGDAAHRFPPTGGFSARIRPDRLLQSELGPTLATAKKLHDLG